MKLNISFVGFLELQLHNFKVHANFLPCWCSSETLACLVMLTCELAVGVNNKVMDNFLRFLKSLGSSLFDVYNFSYD
jgi:hypothetical protein